jgi:hypothetical protein
MDLSSCRTVEDLGLAVISQNRARYGRQLIELVPESFRRRSPEDCRSAASDSLNELRFAKEAELCKKLGVAYPPAGAHEEITYKRCLESFGHGRPTEVGKLCVEIKFLFNVASVLDHW